MNILSLKEAIKAGKLSIRQNILAEKLDFSIYGLKFNELLKDPLSQNFETKSYKVVRDGINSRILGGDQSIIIIDSQFGGGKTHFLSSLFLQFNPLKECQVLALDGHNITYSTLWGEISNKLNVSKEIKNHFLELDKNHQVPSLEELEGLLNTSTPIILLFDEIVVYLKKMRGIEIGGTNLAELSLAFLHTLSIAISKSEKNSIVLSIPGLESVYRDEAEGINKIINGVQSILSRQAPIFSPVELEEVVPIINTHLFEHIDENYVIRISKIMEKYTGLYQKEIAKFFPFHPELIRTLWIDYGDLPGFQKIRGILRILSLSLPHILDDLIISIIPLGENNIINEFTNKIGRLNIKEIILSDMKRAKDQGNESFKIANTLGLYSIINKPVSRSMLKSLCANPNFLFGSVHDVTNQILYHQWHLHDTAEGLIYKESYSLNKIIEDESILIPKHKIREYIQNTLNSLIDARGLKIYFFEIDKPLNDKMPNLLIVHWENKLAFDTIITKSNKGNLRSEINNIILLHGFTNDDTVSTSRLLAVKKIKNKKNTFEGQFDDIIDKIKEEVRIDLINGYNHVTYFDKSLKTIKISGRIDSGLVDILVKEDCIISQLSSEYIVNKILTEIKNPSIRKLHLRFLQDTSLKILKSKQVLLSALIEAVQNKKIEISNNTGVIPIEQLEGSLKDNYMINFIDTKVIQTGTLMENDVVIPIEFEKIQQMKLKYLNYSCSKLLISEINLIIQLFRKIKLLGNNCKGEIEISYYRDGSKLMNSVLKVNTSEEITEFFRNNYQIGLKLKSKLEGYVKISIDMLDEIIITESTHEVLENLANIGGSCKIKITK